MEDICSEIIPINRTYAPLQAFVDELGRCGLRHAVTCPGSRNAPISLTLAEQDGIECVSVIDERSAGFVALGMAKASGLSGGGDLHLRHRGGQPAPGRVRGVGGARAADRADRRPAARAARGGRRAVDRPGQALRQRRQVVRGGGQSRARAARPRSTTARSPAGRSGRPPAAGPGPSICNFPLREPLAPVAEELDAEDWAGPAGRPALDGAARAFERAGRERRAGNWPSAPQRRRAG